MVEVKKDVTLQQPPKMWGAVKERTSYGWWITVTGLYAALISFTFSVSREEFTFRPGEVYSWFGVMLGVSTLAGMGWLWFTTHTFCYSQINFFNDAHAGRNKWAATALRSYLNEVYGTEITEKQAIELVCSNTSTITRKNNGRTEYVTVYLRGLEAVADTLFFSEYTVSEIPDVSAITPKLIIREEPQVPKTFEFFQN